MKWLIKETKGADPERNMAIDRELLISLATEQQVILHFYDWTVPCATYGYFLNPDLYINSNVSKNKLSLIKRPTGGGVIFHLWDFTFSLLIPVTHGLFSINTRDSYRNINCLIIQVLKKIIGSSSGLTLLQEELQTFNAYSSFFCMAQPSLQDIMLNGVKIGGGAQRRTKHGFLHQGTLSLSFPDFDFLSEVILPHLEIENAMQHYAGALLPMGHTQKEMDDFKKQLKESLKESLGFMDEMVLMDENGQFS